MPQARSDLWEVARARHIDRVCDRFEQAWRSSGSSADAPRLEEFLRGDGRDPHSAPDLFRELLYVEVECRGGLGHLVEVNEYRTRFSQFQGVLDELFGRRAVLESVAGAGADPPPTNSLDSPSTCAPLSGRTGVRGSAGPALGDDGTPPDALRQFGPYRILEELGRGGMGVVYLAMQDPLERRVALKMMLPEVALCETSRQRFLREARAAAAIQDDHIVSILHVGEHDGVPFLTMPYLEGVSLETHLRRSSPETGQPSPLPVDEVLRLGREIASGLAAAHAGGLVHRDIKPANIYLEDARRRVKILDFGLARPVNPNVELTEEGAIVGTPAYMAPEQATAGLVDARADLFSLGCVLYRMTAGVPPFKGKDTMSTLLAVLQESPPAPRSLNPTVPPRLSDLILRLLAKDANDRPASAGEVIAILDAVARERPPVRTPDTAPSHPRWPLNRSWMAVALLGIVGVVGGVLGTVILEVRTGKNKMRITVEDSDLDVKVHKDEVHIKDGKLKGNYKLKLVPGKQKIEDYYEIELKEESGELVVRAKELELNGVTAAIVKVDPIDREKPPVVEKIKNPAYDPTSKDLEAYHFLLVNKHTGKALEGRQCDDPRRMSEVLLVKKGEGSKWNLKPQADHNWILELAHPSWSYINLTFRREYEPDKGRLWLWNGGDQTCRWKRVEVEGEFALQTTAGDELGVRGFYLTADEKGDGVHLSKVLKEGSKWNFERVPKKK